MIKIDGLPAKSELKNSQPKPTISSVTTPKKMIDLSKPSLVNEIVSKFNELPKLSNKNIITNKNFKSHSYCSWMVMKKYWQKR